MAKAERKISWRAHLVIFITALATLCFYCLPDSLQLSSPLLFFSTIVHELFHQLSTVVVGLAVNSPNGTPGGGDAPYPWQERAFIAVGGLLGPALFAGLAFLVGRRPTFARFWLIVLGGLLLFAIPFTVKNSSPYWFVGALAALCILLGLAAPKAVCQIALTFFAVQMALSIFSRYEMLFSDATPATGIPSDLALLSETLGFPYWFWGITCGAFSVLVLVFGVSLFLVGEKA